MERDNAIEKIKKLLALSKSDNVGEASNALMLAQKLMLEFNIEVKDLDVNKSEVYVGNLTVEGKSVSHHRKLLALTLSKHFRVSIFLDSSSFNQKISVVGSKEDVMLFSQVFDWTFNTFKRMFAVELANQKNTNSRAWTRSDSLRLQNTYFGGFRKGIDDMMVNNEVSNAIVLVTPKAVSEFMKNVHFSNRTSSVSSGFCAQDYGAFEKGYNAGYESARNKRA